MDWENDRCVTVSLEVSNADTLHTCRDRQKLLSAGGIVDYRCWYPFMYEGRVADETNLAKGLLRGDLLVKVRHCIVDHYLGDY